MEMLIEYIDKKLKQARYKLLEDGTYFGKIPGVRGVWANARNLEDCRKELQEVLEGMEGADNILARLRKYTEGTFAGLLWSS